MLNVFVRIEIRDRCRESQTSQSLSKTAKSAKIRTREFKTIHSIHADAVKYAAL